MDIGKLLEGILPNAAWDLVKKLFGFVGWAGMLVFLVGVTQRIRSGALDWWLLGIVFLGSLALLYVTSQPTGVSSPLIYSLPEEQIEPLDPKDPEERKRLEFGQLLQQQEQTWHQPRPGGFTKDEYFRLRQEFLKIPRPCVFRITVPPENLNVRYDLCELVTTSLVYRPGSTREFIIEPCEVTADPKDDNPKLYADQLDHKPEGIIVVDTTPSNLERAKFVAAALRSGTGLPIRPEANLPPGSPENLIHIKIGRGAMRGFEVTEIR